MTTRLSPFVRRLVGLWTEALGDHDAAVTRFAAVYADPVTINGVETQLIDLVGRAAALQRAIDEVSIDVVDVIETPDRLVIAFHMIGRHTGTLATAMGEIHATGRALKVRTIDLLTITDGRVSGVWVVADELGLVHQLTTC